MRICRFSLVESDTESQRRPSAVTTTAESSCAPHLTPRSPSLDLLLPVESVPIHHKLLLSSHAGVKRADRILAAPPTPAITLRTHLLSQILTFPIVFRASLGANLMVGSSALLLLEMDI